VAVRKILEVPAEPAAEESTRGVVAGGRGDDRA
jgi:hypothetical protein